MIPLPIDRYLPEVVDKLRRSRSLVLVAPPGAGKTTRVPPAILRGGLLSKEHPNIVMLQPRRVAARASAERIASENHWTLGGEAGYHVRFDKKLGPQTRIRVLTEGILTRQLLSDPFLEGIGAVLLDEFHERSLHTDVAVALLREVQQTVREDLMLVIMSATLEAEPAARFLGDCPIVRTEGRTFPVEIEHRPQGQSPLPDQVANAVIDACARQADDAGDVLVFLPGAEEIRRTMSRLESFATKENVLVLPLYGSLPAEEQTRALRPADRRKVILATNIAETSLTIDGVRTVIDSGLARVAGYDPRRGLDRLELQQISKASATQRAGRAGRTAPGRCIRLWSQREQLALADFDLPEIQRVDLAGTVLSLHAWGKPDPRMFGWFEPPPEETLVAAERLLEMLGALSAGKITPLGNRLMSLPVHPRLARLLVSAVDANLLHEGATIAALLSEKDIARSEGNYEARQAKVQGDSDLTVRMQMLEEAERTRFAGYLRDQGIDPMAARQVVKTRDELLRVAKRLGSPIAATPSAAGAKVPGPPRSLREATQASQLLLPLLAYPDRVCRRRASDPKAATMVGGGGVRLAPESCVWQGEFFVALDARQDEWSTRNEALVRQASAIDVAWLEELFPQSIRRIQAAVYDESRSKVVGLNQTFYRDLLLQESRDSAIDPDAATKALADALRSRARELVSEDEHLAALMARMDFLKHAGVWRSEMAFNPESIVDDACLGATTLQQVKQNLRHVAGVLLPYPDLQFLNEHAPDSIAVPTGNRIKLDWSAVQLSPTLRGPVLAVRLQEMFGMTETPRVAGGRVPVVVHLLGPNYRPVQITDDLKSFWATTYFQVRKDLRVKYPKHSWPDDPLTAPPVAKGRSTRR
jgi:ATP-dependent helicase HrpB